jgi:hypothetical protein
MCINASVSIITFAISVFSSIVLIRYGLDKYKTENLIAGVFFIYISVMQLFEFFIWGDINNILTGTNAITSQISALFIFTQPIVLYFIKLIVVKPATFNWAYAVIEGLFFIYVMYCFKNYMELQKPKSCYVYKTTGLLNWSWLNYMDYIIYFSVFIFSIFIYIDFRYAIIAAIWLFSILDLGYWIVPKYYGALFCFIAGLSPIIMLVWQLLFM